MNKLVRDKNPGIIQDNGENCNYHIAGNLEYTIELYKKLVEEAYEVEKTKNKKELIEKLADVMEVIEAISKENGITVFEIVKVRLEKKKEKGGFDKKYILEIDN